MYPTEEQVNKAGREQVCRWCRHLSLSRTLEETKIINLVVEKFKNMGGFTPELSKKIGW